MASKEEVEQFLRQFYQKLEIYDIVYRDDRGKNLSTLALLDIPHQLGQRLLKESR